MSNLSSASMTHLQSLANGTQAIPVSTYKTLADAGLVKAAPTNLAPGKARKFAEITAAGRDALPAVPA